MFKISVIIFFLFGCDSSSWRDWFTLGSVKSVRGDNIEELEQKASKYEKELDEKIEVSDKLGNIYQLLGDKYLERKNWNSAIDSYVKAIGYGEDSPIIHYSIAIAYANRGSDLNSIDDVNKAEHHYKKAVEVSPEFDDASYGLAILYAYAKDDKVKALVILNNLVTRNNMYFNARFALGRIYYELGNLRKSLMIYENLYSDLEKQKKSPQMDKYLKNCKINIERLMTELAGK